MATIAFCGLGVMGWEMAARLAAARHDLRVWNRTKSKADAWVAQFGGVACATAGEAARGADEIHLMLSDDAAVEGTLEGADGALAGLAAGATIVDHSTVSIAGTARRAADLRGQGRRYVHAPMLAGPLGI